MVKRITMGKDNWVDIANKNQTDHILNVVVVVAKKEKIILSVCQ